MGIDHSERGDGDGLIGMRDRVGAVGGTLEIVSSPGRGTTVRGTIPEAVTPRADDALPPRNPDASTPPRTPRGAAPAGNGPHSAAHPHSTDATCCSPLKDKTYYAERYQHTKRRLGRQRGPKLAQIDLARKLTESIWHMLTRNQPFAPDRAADPRPAAALSSLNRRRERADLLGDHVGELFESCCAR